MSGLLIGLTGGIAAGKSSVAAMFRDLGANLLDSDGIAHAVLSDLWEPTTDGRLAGLLQVPISEFSADGIIDRRRLGRILFADQIKRRNIEHIMHPLVAQKSEELVGVLRRTWPDTNIVYESALLVEAGRHKWPDLLVVVCAEDRIRATRLMARNSLTEKEALARLAAQVAQEEKAKLADFVIDNSGTPEETRAQVAKVWENINAQV